MNNNWSKDMEVMLLKWILIVACDRYDLDHNRPGSSIKHIILLWWTHVPCNMKIKRKKESYVMPQKLIFPFELGL